MGGPLRAVAAAALATLAGSAAAQASWSVALESDYRFRGISLSDGRPAAHANFAYDSLAGWYGGASVSTVEFDGDGRSAGRLGYAGIAWRAFAQASLEAGAVFSHFARDSRYDYAEAFAGASGRSWSARVYVSPDYFGQSVRTAYAELDVRHAFDATLRAFAHVGVLARLSGRPYGDASSATSADARVGVGATLGPWDLQFARVAASGNGRAYGYYEADHGAWVLSVAASF